MKLWSPHPMIGVALLGAGFAVATCTAPKPASTPEPAPPALGDPDEIFVVMPPSIGVGAQEAWVVERRGTALHVCIEHEGARGHAEVARIDFERGAVELRQDRFLPNDCSVDWTIDGETWLEDAPGHIEITGSGGIPVPRSLRS